MKSKLVAILVIFVLLVIYWTASCYRESERINVRDFVSGFWLADGDEFCRRAEIASILLYIEAPKRSWVMPRSEHSGWLVINPEVTNQHITLKLGRISFQGNGVAHIPVETHFDSAEIWPTHAHIKLDIGRGVLYIMKDEEIYARLYKSFELSDMTDAGE